VEDYGTVEDDLEEGPTAGLEALVGDIEPSPRLRRRLHRSLGDRHGPGRSGARLAAVATGVALAVSVPVVRTSPSQQLTVRDATAATTPAIRPARAVAKATTTTTTVAPAPAVATPTTTTSVTTRASAGGDPGPQASLAPSITPSQNDDGIRMSSPQSTTTSVPSEETMPAPSSRATTPSTSTQSPSTTEPAPVLTMDLSYEEPLRARDTATWFLTVTNNGGPATLVFRSAKNGEVFLTSESGDVVYNSNRDMMWAAAYREERLGAGASVTYTVAGPPLDVEPGQYLLTADLVSEPAPATVTRTITVAP
jgi:hypothetical protein